MLEDHLTNQLINGNRHNIIQDGKTVFKYAAITNGWASELILKITTNEDVDWLVPHQANRRIIDTTVEWI
jgi:3-oxoacyl-[acyl-carrier-protein] synthase-3